LLKTSFNGRDLAMMTSAAHDLVARWRTAQVAASWRRDQASPAPEPVDTSILSMTARQKFEALERRLRASLEQEIERRVRADVERKVKWIFDKQDAKDAETIRQANVLLEKQHVKPFTAAEYIALVRALHPDSSTAENRLEAFKMVNGKKLVLRAEGRIELQGRRVPRTPEEWDAARRAKQEERKARSGGGPTPTNA
jgi:hypothetical protein